MRNRLGLVLGAITLVAGMLVAPVSAAAEDRPGDLLAARPVTGYEALNHFTAGRLNGESIEPPEQGLCAGNGFVVESVTGAIVMYRTDGSVAKVPATLNSFYGYAPAVTPPAGPPPAGPVFGPQLSDPSCYYDGDTQHWFHVVVTVETDPSSGHATGVNHVDIAVSRTADPTGAWGFHKLYPPAGCAQCLGDFPHIGANADGFFVTTNVYDLSGPTFRSAHVYAFWKRALETNTANAQAIEFDTSGMVDGNQAGFTVWPAQAPSGISEHAGEGDVDAARGGTEFFLSSNAADEVNAAHSGTSRHIILWSLSNTQSLDSDHPELTLTNTVLPVGRYAVPPPAQQKAGDTPLADCLNDTALQVGPTAFGCWRLLHIPPPSHNWSEGQSIDTGDTRMQQVMFAGGLVYGALGTAVNVGDKHVAGIEWFAVRPRVTPEGETHAEVVRRGYLARPDTALISPAIAVDDAGVGVIGFSLMGPNHYPSAAYAPFDVRTGTGDIHIVAAGAGPDDGFTNYAAAFPQLRDPRTRWGDYGAAVVDGSSFWVASEYIAQTCTFVEWQGPPLGRCGNRRSTFANWATRITELAIPD